jgi:hypothetical protein
MKPVLFGRVEVEEERDREPETLEGEPSLEEFPPSPLLAPVLPLWSRLLSKLAKAVLVLGLTIGQAIVAFGVVFAVLTGFGFTDCCATE